MAKWELAVAVCDDPEAHRKKEGDIIAYAPYPHEWGKKEVDEYLIVIVDNLTEEEVRELCSPHFDESVEPDEMGQRPVIGKRKYKLPLEILKDGWLPEIELKKVRNKKEAYQPLKERNIPINAKEKVAIFKDKNKDSFKYKRIKRIR